MSDVNRQLLILITNLTKFTEDVICEDLQELMEFLYDGRTMRLEDNDSEITIRHKELNNGFVSKSSIGSVAAGVVRVIRLCSIFTTSSHQPKRPRCRDWWIAPSIKL